MSGRYFGFSGYQDLKDYYGSPDDFPPEDAIRFAVLDRKPKNPNRGNVLTVFENEKGGLSFDRDLFTEGFFGSWSPGPALIADFAIPFFDSSANEALTRILEGM